VPLPKKRRLAAAATTAAVTSESDYLVPPTDISGGGGGSRRPGSGSIPSRTKIVGVHQNNRASSIQRSLQISAAFTISLAVLAVIYRYREFLLNKEKLQDETLHILRKLYDPESPDASSSLPKSLALYASGMAVWEFLGLSTIPVETAAGMVFGWYAVLASFAGKLTGALAAFCVGRRFFLESAQARLVQYEIFQHLFTQQKQTEKEQAKGKASKTIRWQSRPMTTAFLMKFSCFPELAKNVGTSLLSSVPTSTFVVATLVHGGMFSALWTWWGVETGANMRDAGRAVHGALRYVLVAAAILGLVISPALMAWWIRDLQTHSSAKK